MSKTRVFIYGSCVSRDTFEHLDPNEFELVQYVARQSALSAYTRPVKLIDPPRMESNFQQRMVDGDFASNLQSLIPEATEQVDLIIIDLTDERLGVYVLPDGSVVTRTPELIKSGAEYALPTGSQHIPFGSDQHFEYWSHGVSAIGQLVSRHLPNATLAVLDVPWANESQSGSIAPESFGVTASQANPVFREYNLAAANLLGAHLISLPEAEVHSSPDHVWGEAPFHYASHVYQKLALRINSLHGGSEFPPAPASPTLSSGSGHRKSSTPEPNLLIAGVQRAGTQWLEANLRKNPNIFAAGPKAHHFFNDARKVNHNGSIDSYRAEFSNAADYEYRLERTPGYFWQQDTPYGPRSKHDTASAVVDILEEPPRVLVILRNPVERAISGYWHHVANAQISTHTSIFSAPASLGLIDRGFYSRHYRHWLDKLGAENITLLLFDDLVADPDAFMRDILQLLALPIDSHPFPINGRPIGSHSWPKQFYKANYPSRQEVYALCELYREEVDFVEQSLGRDLSHWRDQERILSRVATPERRK